MAKKVTEWFFLDSESLHGVVLLWHVQVMQGFTTGRTLGGAILVFHCCTVALLESRSQVPHACYFYFARLCSICTSFGGALLGVGV